jgi:diaminopimelate decarboxylase
MKLLGTQQINEQGVLTIGGVDVITLKNMYQTPLYVMDQAMIEENIINFKEVFQSNLIQTEIIYASKAFLNIAMIQLISRFHLSLDVVSGGELFTAIRANFPMEKIYFHGNNKSIEELKLAISHQVGTIIVDNHQELDDIITLVDQKEIKLMVRLNPGVDADTHEYIKTTKNDSKFGLSIFDLDTVKLIQKIHNHPNLVYQGLHVHIGSQLSDIKPYFDTLNTILSFIHTLESVYEIKTERLNLGGGFGVSYLEEDSFLDQNLLKNLIEYTHQTALKLNITPPMLLIEPGRSIVGQSGTTLYTIGSTKKTYSGKSFLFVDGSMADHMRTALYQAKYRGYIANRMNDLPVENYTVAGKACESGDILIKEIKLPIPSPGDLFCVFVTGAYHYSMASNYNRLQKPAVVFVKNGQSTLAVKRETYSDLIEHDISIGGIL